MGRSRGTAWVEGDVKATVVLGRRRAALILTTAVCGLASLASTAEAQTMAIPAGEAAAFGEAGKACRALELSDFSSTQDEMTQVVTAKPVKGSAGVPDYCEVSGYTWPQNQFLLRFPLKAFAGKLIVYGGAGQDGSIRATEPSSTRLGAFGSTSVLTRQWAELYNNGGHVSSLSDTKWSYYNPQQLIDFATRAPHSTTVAAKAILRRFTGSTVKRSYLLGCSNGGRGAMVEAQRFPADFDGIVAGAPSINARNIFLNLFWQKELLKDQTRTGFDMTAARLLHAAAISQCDWLDGDRDRLIGRPNQCKVNLAPLLCVKGPAADCLTEHQANIARRIYEGPKTPDGRQVVPSSAYPGSELSWIEFIAPAWVERYPDDFLRFQAMMPAPGPGFKPTLDDIGTYPDRMGVSQTLMSPLNPDLRAFKARGGKLLSYIGLTDSAGGVQDITDYYGMAERTMGGRKQTIDFFRLFLIPGMNHCGGGEGASNIAFLDILDRWVEADQAPDTITGDHVGPDGAVRFSKTVASFDPSRPW